MMGLKLISIGVALLLDGATLVNAQEREWLLDAAEEDVYLVFGVAETNDIGVSFWCRIGTQKVSIFTALPHDVTVSGSPPQLSLTIDGRTEILAPTLNAESTPPTIEAPLEPQSRFLDALQRAERFTVGIGTHKTTYPLAGADVVGLLRLCGKQTDSGGQP